MTCGFRRHGRKGRSGLISGLLLGTGLGLFACGSDGNDAATQRDLPYEQPEEATSPEVGLVSSGVQAVVAVTQAIPEGGATGVAPDALIKLTFSVPMNRIVTSAATELMCDDQVQSVSAAWDAAHQVLVLTPQAAMSGACAIQVHAGAVSQDGAALAEPFVATFLVNAVTGGKD